MSIKGRVRKSLVRKSGEHLYDGLGDGRGKDKLGRQDGNQDQPKSRKPRNAIS